MSHDPMCYRLQLEMLEQNGVADDEQAIAMLRSEFALAQNAGRFDALTGDDIELGAIWRSTPQEGVTLYQVELLVAEREDGLDDGRALALLCRAFTDALNASYFLRVCNEPLTLSLLSRAGAALAA